MLGINKRAHHSALLRSLDVGHVFDLIKSETVSLARRVFCVPSPYRNICARFLARYIISGRVPAGTLIDRLLHFGICPTRAVLRLPDGRVPAGPRTARGQDGLVDTLHVLVDSSSYRVRGSMEHNLAAFLTKAF